MRTHSGARFWMAVLLLGVGLSHCAELQPVRLPPPQTDGGKPLMQALKHRRTIRQFNSKPLPQQVLSDLLWAAFGVNRPDNGHRTAPSALNAQELDLYVITAEGAFVYEAGPHQLRPVASGDLRGLTGSQPFVKETPVSVVFVADLTRLARAKPADREFYAAVDTGYVSQNIYLFCASEGLATVVHDLDRAPLARALQLRPDQRIILAQAVGYPQD
jgi:nitroreductase